ncbi:MmgE/PrpD family protein [Burkholderia pseudomultivorans]|uniref:2-methylcitrate dehydratase n=1 Tax=Burkholderia pseudomultivorans TaxID=1207504 RepID=A0A132ED49_9BURK|nr:MmgE/PrpD family protein [Burkholderia pseudomultivorans]KWF24848.1 hypothetical protein WT56_00775 [Burkholderia pseudomultivorans]
MDATTLRIARYAREADYTRLAPDAIHECRRRLVDSVACAAAASAEALCAGLRAFAARYSAVPAARLWGSGQPTSPEMAAFVNGTMLRYVDYSDTVLAKTNGHPSDMIGGLVAVGEAFGCDGASLVTAIVVAYEVYCSLCASVPLQARGIDQGTAAAAGTAVGAARLLDLSHMQIAQALSLTLASNLHLYNVRSGELSDWKGCGGPNGSRNGVFAALLAREGITGPSAAVEGKGGLFEVVGAFDWQVGSAALPLITQTHLKLHPVCYHGQSAVDAALALRGHVSPDSIAAIEIETYDAAYRAMGSDPERWAPSNRETADHSLPYAVAAALKWGCLTADAYEDQHLRDAEILSLMEKIRVCTSPEMTKAFPVHAQTRITLRMHDGTVHTHLQDNPKGNAANPLSDDELEVKFVHSFAPWGDAAEARRTLDVLWSVDRLPRVADLVDALCHSRLA